VDQSFEEMRWTYQQMKDKDQEHVYVSGNELTSKLYFNYF
jgi:hypothetical protein